MKNSISAYLQSMDPIFGEAKKKIFHILLTISQLTCCLIQPLFNRIYILNGIYWGSLYTLIAISICRGVRSASLLDRRRASVEISYSDWFIYFIYQI